MMYKFPYISDFLGRAKLAHFRGDLWAMRWQIWKTLRKIRIKNRIQIFAHLAWNISEESENVNFLLEWMENWWAVWLFFFFGRILLLGSSLSFMDNPQNLHQKSTKFKENNSIFRTLQRQPDCRFLQIWIKILKIIKEIFKIGELMRRKGKNSKIPYRAFQWIGGQLGELVLTQKPEEENWTRLKFLVAFQHSFFCNFSLSATLGQKSAKFMTKNLIEKQLSWSIRETAENSHCGPTCRNFFAW